MIDLDLRDLRKEFFYVVRIYGKEIIKLTSKTQLKGVKKAFNCIGVSDKDIHIYKVNIRKVDLKCLN